MQRCIALVLALAYVVGRDLPGVSWTAAFVAFSGLSVPFLTLAVMEFALSRVPSRPVPEMTFRLATVAVSAVFPLVLGLIRSSGDDGSLPRVTPLCLVATAAAVAAGQILAWRAGIRRVSAIGPGRLLASLWLAGAFWAVHDGIGTLEAVRPGTAALHVVFYCGLWLASAALVLPLGSRPLLWRAGRGDDEPSPWLSPALAVAGLVAVEADRGILPDLYEPAHLWLCAIGIACIDTAVGILLTRRSHRAATAAGRVSAVLLAVLPLATVVRPGALADLMVRADLGSTASGAWILNVMPGPTGTERCRSRSPGPPPRWNQMLDEPPPVPDLSLLLVTIDSLRADIVERDTGGLPRIRDLAARSVRYRRAYAQGTRTAMALGTLMTGRYSARVDWELWQYRRGRLFPLSEALLSGRAAGRRVFTTLPRVAPGAMLAERLRRAGLRTLAAVHGGTDEFMKPDLAFARGFDAFVDPAPGERRVPSSNLVADTAVSQLEKAGDDKIFQWVHILDPHEADGSRSEYEKLVAEADRALGRILDALERTGRADRTAVVVTADHGESFGEHRRGRHGTSLYDEQTRIPLLVRMPGATPRDEMRPVAAIDIAATLLVLGGADTSGIDGVNLVPSLVRGAMPEHRPVFIELHRYVSRRARPTHDMKGVIAAPLKLIVDRKRWTAELFDIVADPAETRNLIRRRPDDFRRLEALLDAFICDAERSHPLP